MKLSAEHPKIIVVGSSSVDLVLTTEKHPLPNETVLASKSGTFFGGKGANQAVAAARLGGHVYFIGCVGMDPLGQQIMRNLVDEGINVGFVHESEYAETGTAYVNSVQGQNTILVVPAANFHLKPKHVEHAEKYFDTADIVLIQLEVPMETVEYTVKLAKKHRLKVGIYAAPAQPLSKEILDYASFIVAKSSELKIIFGEHTTDNVLKTFPNKLFVRDDNNSTTFYNGNEMKYHRSHHDHIVYKMGMGDAFTAGFAIALCHGNAINDCVKFGNKVALKVSANRDSQTALPYLKSFIDE